MLSQKIALISHTLEVDSPRERVPESAAVDAHKDTESDPSLQLHSAVYSRNSPTQTHVQEDLKHCRSPTLTMSTQMLLRTPPSELIHLLHITLLPL